MPNIDLRDYSSTDIERLSGGRLSRATLGALVGAGVIHNVGSGRSLRISPRDAETLLDLPQLDLSNHHGTYRVSVAPMKPDHTEDDEGNVIRTHRGVDLNNTYKLSPLMQERAFTSFWPVSTQNERLAVERQSLLVASLRGYVHPTWARRITGASRPLSGGRVLWETAPLTTKELETYFPKGPGLIEVPRGSVSGWL